MRGSKAKKIRQLVRAGKTDRPAESYMQNKVSGQIMLGACERQVYKKFKSAVPDGRSLFSVTATDLNRAGLFLRSQRQAVEMHRLAQNALAEQAAKDAVEAETLQDQQDQTLEAQCNPPA